MDKAEDIQRPIRDLTPQETVELHEWFAASYADAWDRQLEADGRAGKLDALADNALRARA